MGRGGGLGVTWALTCCMDMIHFKWPAGINKVVITKERVGPRRGRDWDGGGDGGWE